MRKLAAVLEVIGVYMLGQLIGFGLATGLGFQLRNPLLGITKEASQPQLYQAAWDLVQVLFFQYFGWFLLAFLVGWWHRRRKPSGYGLTRNSQSWTDLISRGVLTFAVAGIFTLAVHLVHSLVPLGETTEWRKALFEMEWTPAFWVLTAAGSYLLIPPLEELFYRGYVQTRLEEDLGPPAAILGAAGFFVFSHSQYKRLDLLNLSTVAGVLIFALAVGYMFYLTRSLVPGIVAHALINVPVRGLGLWLVIIGAVLIWILMRKDVAQHFAGFRSLIRLPNLSGSCWAAIGALSIFSFSLSIIGEVATLIGIVAFVLAVSLEWKEKRAVDSR